MSWIGTLLKNIGGSLLDNLGGFAQAGLGLANLNYQRQKDEHLTGAQQEANAFSAAEAQKARDWQEMMYTQYQSPQALMRQAQEAGINPAALYGQAFSGHTPSASTGPSSVTPQGGDTNGAISQLISLAKSVAEIDNLRSSSELNRQRGQSEQSARDKISAEIGVLLSEKSLNENQRSRLLAAQEVLTMSEANLADARKELADVERTNDIEQGKIIKQNADFLIEHGFTRDQAALVLAGVLSGSATAILKGIGDIVSLFTSKGKNVVETIETVDPLTGEVFSSIVKTITQIIK